MDPFRSPSNNRERQDRDPNPVEEPAQKINYKMLYKQYRSDSQNNIYSALNQQSMANFKL